MPCHSSSNPGLAIVDKKYKFSFNRIISTKDGEQTLYYTCTSSKKSKTSCRATALLARNETQQTVTLVKCSSGEEHNHDATEAAVVVAKMKNDMVERMKADPNMSIKDCMA